MKLFHRTCLGFIGITASVCKIYKNQRHKKILDIKCFFLDMITYNVEGVYPRIGVTHFHRL